MSASEYSDVFISYRRTDVDFVKQLVTALQAAGKEVWVDWEDIPPGSVGFTDDIKRGLQAADAFIAVLSPDYLNSPYCVDMELAHALTHNKKVIPIIYRKFDDAQTPEGISHINWIYFIPHAGHENSFEDGVKRVLQALDQDVDHMRQHKRLLLRAVAWDEDKRDESHLLDGEEITRAETWLAQAAGKKPLPTDLHREFIAASRAAAVREQEEQLRLQRRAINRLRYLVGIMILFSIVTVVLLGMVIVLQQQTDAARRDSAWELGATSYALGDYGGAIAYYSTLIDEYDVEDAYDERGRAYLANGQYTKAVADFDRVIASGLASAEDYNNRGLAYAGLGDFNHAFSNYDQAIALNPEYAEAYNNRGLANAALGDYPRAINDFDSAIALNPDFAEAYANKGKAQFALEEYQPAIENLSRAAALDETLAEAYLYEGMAHAELGHNQDAMFFYSRAISIRSNYAEAYYQRALVAARTRLSENAFADYASAVQIDSAYAETSYKDSLVAALEAGGYRFAPPRGGLHRVSPADTLFMIALRYGVTEEAIITLNELTDERLYPGMELQIPTEPA